MRKPGTGRWAQEPQQKADTPSLRACPLLPHKGQKGTWEEAGPRGGARWWDWAAVLSPQGREAAFATEAKQDPGQVGVQRAGASRGERGQGAPSRGVSRPAEEGDAGEAVGRPQPAQVTGSGGKRWLGGG